MQYLFDVWRVLEKKLQTKKPILLCLDFDGTIVPIKPRPQDAILTSNRRLILRKISRCKPLTLGVISGRALRDIREKIKIKGLIYAGNHGLEIAYQNQVFIYPRAKKYVPVISKIGRELTKALKAYPETTLEKKGLSLSLHYRLLKQERVARLKKTFLQILKPYLAAQKIKLTSGKKVWELRPPIAWDKGRALLWLRQRLSKKNIFTLYLGDDLTDEDAFCMVNKINGISVLVGRRKNSQAKYYLKNTQDTQKFLEQILTKCPK